MLYEVFISYSRRDPGICRQVREILERLAYSVFVDHRDLPAGFSWTQELTAAIDQARYLVVLATREACAKPDNILKEVRHAAARGVLIIPVECDPDTADTLLRKAEVPDIVALQHISVHRDGDRCADPELLENRLRLAMTHRMEQRLAALRSEAAEWASQLRPSTFFRQSHWQGLIPQGKSVALIGPSGIGKSVLAAHFIDDALSQEQQYVVVLRGEAIAGGAIGLARALDARDPTQLLQRLQDLRDRDGHALVFVIDGLDQVDFADGAIASGVRALLALLLEAGQVVITSQKLVWQSSFAGRVLIDVQEIGELDRAVSTGLLPAASDNTLLRTPFFLDLALRPNHWGAVPEDEVDFLRRLFSDAEQLGCNTIPASHHGLVSALLRAMAEIQLEQMAFDIPLELLMTRLSHLASADVWWAIHTLEDQRMLVERTVIRHDETRQHRVRLAHDLLDTYSMARQVRTRADLDDAVQDLCRRCHLESGWQTLAMLVRIGAHCDQQALLDTIFGEILSILDRKKFEHGVGMAQAWAVTYVLNAQLPVLMSRVLHALSGHLVASLTEDHPGDGSSGGQAPRLTVEAASSLGASFQSLDAGSRRAAITVVPVLERCLKTWPLRARFIDALSRYDTDRVREILVGFGDDLLASRDDLPCLGYVAQGLERLGRHPSIRDLLDRIVSDDEVDAVTRRRAYTALDRSYDEPEPDRDETEIVFGLRTHENPNRYSDWNVVREYALHVRTSGRVYGPAVRDALIKALGHDMTFVWQPVALALERFHDPQARAALAGLLVRPVLPEEVRIVCYEVLQRSLTAEPDLATAQAFRLMLLRAARLATQNDLDTIAADLTDLALSPAEWLGDAGALEATTPFPAGAQVVIHPSFGDGPPVNDEILSAVAELGAIDTGPDLEAKFRITELEANAAEQTLAARLTPTTWTASRRFHHLITESPDKVCLALAPIPLGNTVFPGLAVVHAIVLSADKQVLFTQRSHAVAFAPSHWSASFEEQINEKDADIGLDPFTHAAQRGYAEEFGCEIAIDRISLLSTILELDGLNLGVVMLLRPQQSAAQIEQTWRAGAEDQWEADRVGWLPLAELEHGIPMVFRPPHPTARIRCAALLRYLRPSAR